MPDLITVPTFTFKQGNIFNADPEVERPITVSYYNGTIELLQDGEYDQPEKILIHPSFLNKLFQEIKKHLPEALECLKK